MKTFCRVTNERLPALYAAEGNLLTVAESIQATVGRGSASVVESTRSIIDSLQRARFDLRAAAVRRVKALQTQFDELDAVRLAVLAGASALGAFSVSICDNINNYIESLSGMIHGSLAADVLPRSSFRILLDWPELLQLLPTARQSAVISFYSLRFRPPEEARFVTLGKNRVVISIVDDVSGGVMKARPKVPTKTLEVGNIM